MKQLSYENKPRRATLLLVLFLWAGTFLHANDVLERSISVRFDHTPLKEVLEEIAKQGGFQWSYNAGILDNNLKISLVANGWTVREVLLHVLGDTYTFKQNGEYLILKKRKKTQQHLSGYISDRSTGRRMANVTVYDRQTLRSTTTDKHGYYELPVNPRSEVVISKLSYRDTVLHVDPQTPRLVKLDMYTDSVPQNEKSTFREEMSRFGVKLEQFFVSSSQKMSSLNIRDSLHRYFQVSFLPVLGTNHRLSGSVTNDWSLNLLVGYSRGNRRLELGGLGNINRENVTGLQAAGLFNITGGHCEGLQTAGLFNNLGKDIRGAQFAGVYNYAGGQVRGAQFGGIANIARSSTFQSAGIFNSADSVRGCQIAGIFNRAGRIKGTQIGLVNFAREIDGAQIGLVNYSRHGGYVVLEASANDVFLANIAFKSGVPGIYTILTAGFDPEYPSENPSGDHFWAYGAGLGAQVRMTRWASLNFDLIHRHLNEGGHDNVVQEWDQLAVSLDLHFGQHFSIAGGPSANLFIADPNRLGSATIRDRIATKNWLDTSNNADGWLSAWPGWTAAVRVRF